MLPRITILVLACLMPCQLQAQNSIEKLLPSTTAAVLKINEPGQVVRDILEHPLVEAAEEAGAYKQALAEEQAAQLDAIKAQIKATIGMEWDAALDLMTSGGVMVAFDPPTNGACVIVQGDEATLEKVFDILMTTIEPLAALGGNPVNKGLYRETITGYQIDDIRFALYKGTFVITNSRDLGRRTLDTLLGDTPDMTLGDNPTYQQATQSTNPDDHTLWFWVDSKLANQTGELDNLDLSMKTNMLAELLFGGITNQLRNSKYTTASLDFDKEKLRFSFRTTHNHEWIPERRYYYFGEDGKGMAPSLLHPKGTIASISMYRDLAPWYLLGPELYTPEVNEGIAQADSQLSNFLGGKDFGEDLLGALEPGFQIVVTETEFEEDAPRPDINIPSFALVANLRDPEIIKPELRRQFINFVGFINLLGGMEGGKQLDLDIQNIGDDVFFTTAFLQPQPNQPVSLEYNFTPTLVLTDELLILSSTKMLASTLQETKPQKRRNGNGVTTNAQFQLHGSSLTRSLQVNRDILVTQNMLDNGSTRQQAGDQVDLILKLTQLIKMLELKLEHTDSELTFTFDLSFVAE